MVKQKKPFIFACVSIILVLVSIMGSLVLYDVNKSTIFSKVSSECLNKIICNCALCKPTILSTSEFDGLVSHLTQEKIHILSVGESKEQNVKIYVPVSYNNIHLGITSYAKINLLDDNFQIKLYNTKIGRLPVSTKIMLASAKKYFPTEVSIVKDTILIPASFRYNVNKVNVSLKVSEVSILNDSILIKTTGSLNGLTIKDGLNSLIKNFINKL